MADLPVKKNAAFTLTFPIFDGDGDLVSGITFFDSEISKDGAAFEDCTNEVSEISDGIYTLVLTAAEMNADIVAIRNRILGGPDVTTGLLFVADSEDGADVDDNLTDNNTGTWWESSTGAFPHYVTIDLGASVTNQVEYVRVFLGASPGSGTDASVDEWSFWGSNEASPTAGTDDDWTQIGVDQNFANSFDEWQEFDFAGADNVAEYRWYKLKFHDSHHVTDTQVKMAEITLEDATAGKDNVSVLYTAGAQMTDLETDISTVDGVVDDVKELLDPQTDLTTGKTASAETESNGNTAAKAIDGNTGSYWESDGSLPHWWEIDLGTNTVVNHIRFTPYDILGHCPRTVEIYGSIDGGNFFLLAIISIPDLGFAVYNGLVWRHVTFNNKKAYRYYKLNITALHDGATDVVLAEVEMYNVAISASGVRDEVLNVVNTLGTPTGSDVVTDIASILTRLGTPADTDIATDIANLGSGNSLKVLINKRVITGTQMIIYDDDGTTPLYTFNLLDASGNPTSRNVKQLVPV
jgi:hypothetical protein